MPEITLSLPAALGLVTLFLAVGAVLVYFALRQTQPAVAEVPPTSTPTITLTLTPTSSPTPETPTPTNPPEPSPTPFTYNVKLNDTCSAIAFNFGVSIQSIVLLNNLPADCGALFEGQALQIPQPTPTATPQPSATLSPAEATDAACTKVEYVVQENDTLGAIAANYGVPKEAISEYNGLVNDVVRFNQSLTIPLCMRAATPGPSPTPTLPPPYSAPNPLLPPDGQAYMSGNEIITLQWSAVGTLRENERYYVTVEDVTSGENRPAGEYTTDTKYIVPASLRPPDNLPHIFRWTVTTVRQAGTDEEGQALYESAGAVSEPRNFTWVGTGSGAPPPSTPAP